MKNLYEKKNRYPDIEQVYKDWVDKTYGLDAWQPRDIGWFHPSSASGCVRKVAFDFLGVKPEEGLEARTHRIFGNGHWMHDRLQKEFIKSGLLIEGSAETPCSHPHIPMRGHSDGVMDILAYDHPVIDFKSISSNGFSYIKKAPKDDHIDQVHCYMDMLGKEWALLLYENKNNQEWKIHWVKFDPRIINRIYKRFEIILNGIKQQKLPKKEGKNGMDSPCRSGSPRSGYWFCPYVERCHSKCALKNEEWKSLVGRLPDVTKKILGCEDQPKRKLIRGKKRRKLAVSRRQQTQ